MASDNNEENTSYVMRGNVPEKFILRPLKNEEHAQQYFSAYRYGKIRPKEGQDFDELNGLYDKVQQCSLLSIKNKQEPGDIIVDNMPIKIKIIGAINQSFKQNGSNSVIRVLLPNGYATNISSDILFESIYKSGCDINGELIDSFIVISNSKSLVIVREQSGLHLSCLDHMGQMAKPKMSKMSFNVGSTYKTATNAEALFLGYITTLVPKIKIEYQNPLKNNYKIVSAKYEYVNVKTGTLWYPVYYYQLHNQTLTNAFNNDLKSESFMGSLKIVTGNSHSFIVQSDREPIQIENVMQIVHSAARSAEIYMNKQLKFIDDQSLGKGPHFGARVYPIRWYQLENITRYGKFSNLELFGLKAKKSSLYDKIEKLWFAKFIAAHNSYGDTSRPV